MSLLRWWNYKGINTDSLFIFPLAKICKQLYFYLKLILKDVICLILSEVGNVGNRSIMLPISKYQFSNKTSNCFPFHYLSPPFIAGKVKQRFLLPLRSEIITIIILLY